MEKRRYNAYHTDDPHKLLDLKRQESRVILDIVRSIQINAGPTRLIEMVILAIRNQLDVNKIIFITNFEAQKKIEVNINFQSIDVSSLGFLDSILSTSPTMKGAPEILREIGVEYIVPLGNRSQAPIGWFLIADFAETPTEALNDLIFIETVGNILIMSLENLRLFEERLRQQSIHQELELAGKIQKQALPSSFNFHPQLDIHAVNIAHFKVAGDFYDLVPINSDEFYLCMADVAGKGISSALLVANLQANFRALALAKTSFHHIIYQLNEAIGRLTNNEQFVTIFIAKINIRTKRIAYVNAGHNPPFLIRDKRHKELQRGTIPLGMLPIDSFDIGSETFNNGDMLFLFTDGVVEQTNPKGELISNKQILEYLLQAYNANAKEIVDKILDMIWEHAQYTSSSDDISMMVVRFL